MYADAIKKWFRLNEFGGLILPDGWYGRPYDNQHRLAGVKEHGRVLEISLDEGNVTVVFNGLGNIREDGKDLVLSKFERVAINGDHVAGSYGDGEIRLKSYQDS